MGSASLQIFSLFGRPSLPDCGRLVSGATSGTRYLNSPRSELRNDVRHNPFWASLKIGPNRLGNAWGLTCSSSVYGPVGAGRTSFRSSRPAESENPDFGCLLLGENVLRLAWKPRHATCDNLLVATVCLLTSFGDVWNFCQLPLVWSVNFQSFQYFERCLTVEWVARHAFNGRVLEALQHWIKIMICTCLIIASVPIQAAIVKKFFSQLVRLG